jgi:RNA polymerase sigma-70 factor, ECF subfamily
VLRNKEDAEDAVQDGWCRAYIKLHTFQGRSSLSTWLARIIINSALMIRRRNKHVQISLGHESEGQRTLLRDLVDNRPTPEQACRDGEMNGLLVQQIHRLPSATRAAVLLRDVDELTVEESTKLLGIKKSAMKSRTRRSPEARTEDAAVTSHRSAAKAVSYQPEFLRRELCRRHQSKQWGGNE